MQNNTSDIPFSLKSSLPKTVVIEKITDEAEGFRTFFFRYDKVCLPGQFLMLWLPRIDEKPFTLSYQRDGLVGVTVARRGEFTAKLFDLAAGDTFGVRGPFGRGYTLHSKHPCVIGGGSGAAAVLPLADTLKAPKIIIGARTRDALIYREALPEAIFATDDGSFGLRGTVVDALAALLETEPIDTVYVCGPERMTAAIIDLCKERGIACQFALERYMKCGIGICGNCTCGGARVCVDGPVFDLDDLPVIDEFMKITRTNSGKEVQI